MKKRMLTLAVAAILISGMLPDDAKAAITLGFDMDTSTTTNGMGIETERSVSPGQVFDVAVYLDVSSTGSPTLLFGNFSLDVTYETDHLTLIEGNSFFTVQGTTPQGRASGAGQLTGPMDPVFGFATGSVGPFNGNVTSALNNPQYFWLGVLQFQAMNVTNMATTETLLGFQNVSSSSTFSIVNPTSSTLVVTAVPEPSALWLCASVGFFARLTRRRRNACT